MAVIKVPISREILGYAALRQNYRPENGKVNA